MFRTNRRGEPFRRSRFSRKRVTATLFIFLAAVTAILLYARSGQRTSETELKSATEAWDAGNFKLAAKEFERYIQRHPGDERSIEARFQLANVYYLNLKLYDQALTNYKKFLDEAPAHPQAAIARERMAEVLAELGRSYEAIAEYENLAPQEVLERRRVRLRIADLYFGQKNYSQALTEYAKVTEDAAYDELSEQAYLREASVYHIVRGQYQQALPAYQKLASQSSDPEVRLRATYGLADCYAGLYQFDEAINILRDVSDANEQSYIARRVAELERQKREAAQARGGLPQ